MKLTGTAILALVALAGGAFVIVRYGPGLLKAIDPTNPDNVFSTGANAVVASVTGDPNQTVGGGVFDVLHPNAGLAPGETSLPGGIILAAPAVTPGGTSSDDLILPALGT